ncbi:MAG TPA: maltose alpha-D-glucosyltransferase [Burkholderiales bacterium]|nr:maltose alpha-D-glucosyltransferase [Burkholderiales bacterium]
MEQLSPQLLAIPTPSSVDDEALWYKDAIIYELHVKAFFDANNDGMGDFKGLSEKLDYIQDLGVNTIWLLPFYPSPMRDDGYDVSDYHNVHPSYGTRQDFRLFVREAHRRNLRVITELVVNHTSDQHPWFQAARRAPKGSSKRDYYVWSDDPHKYAGTRIIFTDTEASNWSWDEVAQSHYWHRFFSHQPDLNFDNPHVLKAIVRTMRFWLDMGVDGFRLDAIPYLIERDGTNNENLPETHDVIKKIRAMLDEKHKNRLLLAEANQWPEDVREYFGNGDECHMAYHFPLMPRLFLAIAQEDRYPVLEIMRQTPDIPENCQWAIFLRNHDELTLEMVTDRERDYMYQIFATDPRMRINVGIRRRLAPLMENDRAKIELMSFLLLTLPGSPIVYYGDEIGMGDNIYLGDRNGVRTPMQWSPDRNAGFSRADPQRLYLPANQDASYGYQSVNVESQARNPSSLLNWTRRMIGVRKGYKAFGRGTLSFLEPGNRKVLVYLREYKDETMLCITNLSRFPQAAEIELGRFEGRVPVEIIGRTSFPPIGKLPYLVTLPGYGYYVFRLATDAAPPNWHEARLADRELPTLVMIEGLKTFFAHSGGAKDVRKAISSRSREQLQREVLLPYLLRRRWYAAKSKKVTGMDIVEEGEWRVPEGSWLISFLRVDLENAPSQQYFLPLGVAWEEPHYNPMDRLGASALARVREKAKTGILVTAFGDPVFCRALARSMGENKEIPFGKGKLRFTTTPAFAQVADSFDEEIRIPAMEQSNTGVFFGHRAYLKGYRRMQPGANPELEVGRFLTVTSPFAYTAPVAGYMEYIAADGTPTTLAVLQPYMENQGNLWDYSLNYLERYLMARDGGKDAPEQAEEEAKLHAFFLVQATKMGQRIGQLHEAFAKTTGDPAFDPEPVSAEDFETWRQAVRTELDETLDSVAARREKLPETVKPVVDQLLASRESLARRIAELKLFAEGLLKTRYHGDLHFGQVLIAHDDYLVVDFEGEPGRTLEERRRKHSPLRDVAGMIRSADYAARMVLTRFSGSAPEQHQSMNQAVKDWRRSVTAAFMHGYRLATKDVPSVPREDEVLDDLVELFIIEKSLYEMRYEMDNRPDWLDVPVSGLLEISEEGTQRKT